MPKKASIVCFTRYVKLFLQLTQEDDDEKYGGEDRDAEEHVEEVLADQVVVRLQGLVPHDRGGDHEPERHAQLERKKGGKFK